MITTNVVTQRLSEDGNRYGGKPKVRWCNDLDSLLTNCMKKIQQKKSGNI